jgi:hypothetical protein
LAGIGGVGDGDWSGSEFCTTTLALSPDIGRLLQSRRQLFGSHRRLTIKP